MVDPHQVFIENANNSAKISETPNSPANLIQMNSSDTSKYQIQPLQRGTEVQSVDNSVIDLNAVHENKQNVYSKVDNFDDIMCGPSTQNCPDSTIQSNDDNSANSNAFINCDSNGESSQLISNNFVGNTESIDANPNKVCVFVNNKQSKESNDSHSEQMLPSKPINSTDIEIQNNSAEIRPNKNIAFDNKICAPVTIPTNKMDSRKVEPLRININRDPIKTKIKLGPLGERQNISPKSSSSSNAGVDVCDDVKEEIHENQQSYPKFTIKPIVKPPADIEHHHNHNAGLHMPSSSQEAIPKLKIKKVDSNNSNSCLTPLPSHLAASNSDGISGNYQTHLLSESNSSVPK